ncbi:MAG: carboxypeptidase-like regulatory domain-containing protein [Bacteroidetes bacterium]|nr:carboxypeptidase-like regulatory domain-containing protein [Bacteroidota bacterium]
MKKVLPFWIVMILSVLFVLPTQLSAQELKMIRGIVRDKQTKEVLPGTNIQIKGTTTGTVSGIDGTFELAAPAKGTAVLMFSYIGYASQAIVWHKEAKLEVMLESASLPGTEVVISASRLNQEIRQAPIAIQKLNAQQINNSASGDYFNSLSNLRDVEIISNSIGFGAFNTRGFNSTSPLRVVQLIDGVDNQLPTINIATGNMFGISDIDIENLEIISGPASALYGANAMQGVISYTSKSAYTKQGVSAEIKGGSRDYMSGQFRFADTYGKQKRLGIKLTASHMNASDWVADDPVANRYGKQPSPPQNLTQLIESKSQAGNVFEQFMSYSLNNSLVLPGKKQFLMPGFMESTLWDGKVNNTKFSGTLNYKLTEDLTATYNYRYSEGKSVYMGNNRAPLDGFNQQLHYIGLNSKHYQFKAYRSSDDTKNTYAMNATGTLLGFASLPSVTGYWSDAYVNELNTLTNNFALEATQAMVDQANQAALTESNNGWLVPGTAAFNTAIEKIKSQSPPVGSRFASKTVLYHTEFDYNRSYRMYDFNFGVSYRYMSPESKGTTFMDTLQQDGSYRKIKMNEYAGYLQGIANLPGNHWKVLASVRLDKNEYYAAQFSPRLALTYQTGEQHFRLSAQSAFRSPTLTDLFQYLNKGTEITLGNANGVGNLYTYSSVVAFQNGGSADPGLLKTTYVDAVKPEQLQSLELGYSGTWFKSLITDFSIYYNNYRNFIVYQQVVQPKSGTAGEASGVADIASRNYQRYAVATNSKTDVSSLGFSAGLGYYVTPKIKAYFNYTYASIDSSGIAKDQIPGFNTPKHKVNLGVGGQEVIKQLGFNVNFRYVDSYYWESVFASGPVPSYNTLDVQLNYVFPKLYSTLKVGGANVFNNKYIQAYGMPQIGAFYYASWTFDLDFKH